MDTSGFDQVGRYGTLSLLKAGNAAVDESSVVTSFGIDTAPLTFGSAISCDVRLYYPDVEKVHCKIVFNEERKAFLAIQGTSGVHIDGCQVYPNTSSGTSSTGVQETPQTIIPLTNHSVFEIHGKRFRFSYPPKEARKAIFDTPPQQKRRALRLSMINSAEVFSPRPSKDPRENLRILQSPLKPTFMKSPSKLRTQSPASPLPAPQLYNGDDDDDEDDDEEEIVLVETNHPRVVEEDKDLVILEDAPLPIPRTQSPQPPVTPRRRSMASNALHRAVLIRSAQRAVIRAERVREEEEDLEEEAEVFGTVLEEDEDIIGDDEGLEEDDEIHDVEMGSPGEADEARSEEESTDDDEGEEEESTRPTEQQKSLWRKSIERMWPFRSASPERPPDTQQEPKAPAAREQSDSEEDEDEDEEMQALDQVSALPSRNIASTPIRRALGSFMTPQQHQGQRIFGSAGGSQAATGAPASRFSLGGGEAQRVVVQRPWKVKDLVVPATEPAPPPLSPMRPPPPPVQNTPIKSTPKLTLEEKKAIQERRRSAVRQPDNFFAGGIPGMSPNKASSSSAAGGAASWRASTSPTKGMPLDNMISEQEEKESPFSSRPAEEDPVLDTQVLMDRMKNTVEDLKRRKSMATGGLTPQPFAPPMLHARTEARPELPATRMNIAPRHSVGVGAPSFGPIKKLDFSAVTTTPARKSYEAAPITPKPTLSTPVLPPLAMEDDKSESEEPSSQDLPVFSLLRPAGQTDAASRRSTGGGLGAPMEVEPKEATEQEDVPSARAVLLPEVVVQDDNDVQMESEEEESEPIAKDPTPKKTRSRLLRPSKAKEPVNEPSEAVEEPKQASRKPPSRSRSKPPSTSLAAPATRTRSKSPIPPQEEESSEDVTPPQPSRTREKPPSTSKTPATARRGRKAAATPEPTGETEDETQTPMTATGRKARKPRVEPPETVEEQPEPEPETESEPVAEPVVAKRGRPKKPASTETKSKIPAAAKPAAKSRSRVRQVQEEMEEDDPLDSYNVDNDAEEVVETPAPAPARSRATKIPAAASRTRTTKKVIKQEEEAQPEPVALAPAKTSRSTRVNATPAATTTATKGRKLRTPATAPAAVIADKGKENMSGSGSGSDLVADAEEGLTKVRVSRTRGTTTRKTAAAKAEEVPVEIPEAPVKATRAKAAAAGTSRTARSRTKTG